MTSHALFLLLLGIIICLFFNFELTSLNKTIKLEKIKPDYHTCGAVVNHFFVFDIVRLTRPACSFDQLCSWQNRGKYRQKTLPPLKTRFKPVV